MSLTERKLSVLRVVLTLGALGLAACDVGPGPSAGLTLVSRAAIGANCGGGPQSGVVYPGSKVEPHLAADLKTPGHLVGVWQQDRWSDGGAFAILTGASFDGGRTWTESAARFSRCTGGDFVRASDPWVTIGPAGSAYQIALAFNQPSTAAESNYDEAILVSRSSDGGLSWSAPIALAYETSIDVGFDKPSITADLRDPNYVYAVWSRSTGLSVPNNPSLSQASWIARSTNGGATWEPARLLYDPGSGGAATGNELVVLPDGTLIDLFSRFTQANLFEAVVSRSSDNGSSWSEPVTVDGIWIGMGGTIDRKSAGPGVYPRQVRTGLSLPHISVDANSGALYAVWEDQRFATHTLTSGVWVGGDGIVLSKSTDGGLTWSTPVPVNQFPATQAFTPSIAVARDGTIGITYYDFRDDDPADRSRLLTNHWLVTSRDGTTWTETPLGGSFDIRLAPYENGSGDRGYFLGDYEGLAHDGNAFVPLFAMTDAAGIQPDKNPLLIHQGAAFTGLPATDSLLNPTDIFVRAEQ